jgi:RimJ/RimL family protein N-acetyltransferase
MGALAETARLVIRPWRPEEVDRFFDIYSREEVSRWFSSGPMRDRSEAVARLQRSLDQLAADGRFGSWAVVERGAIAPAGTILLKALPDGDGEIEIGWHLHPGSWGRGIATEAAGAVLAHAFAVGVPEVWAVVDPRNHRSAAVAHRIGMRLTGVTHRWYHEPSLMFWAGPVQDSTPSLAPDGPLPPELEERR